MTEDRQNSSRKRAAVIELPPCPGPKLGAFQDRNAPIEWVERLDKDRENYSEIQGCVFRARIRSKEYAIKVFIPFDPETTRWYWEPILGESFPEETVTFHTDPFYAECRAYGRIREAQIKGKLMRDVAVRCHGFLILKEKDEKILRERGDELGITHLVGALFRKTGRSNEVRAIVKDLAPESSGVDSKSLVQILRDIRWLKRNKIYNRDIRAENFKGGKLVDFGSAVTEPHCILETFDKIAKEEARDTRSEDLVLFDDMIAEEGLTTDVRAMPSLDYCRKLRQKPPSLGKD